MENKNRKPRLSTKWYLLSIPVVLILLIGALFIPWNISGLTSTPHPAATYDEALQKIGQLKSRELPTMNPDCSLQLLTHQQKVDNVIIMVHGYTNCPKQFSQLGKKYFDLGYNVLIAPLPYHGSSNRMDEAHAQLKAEDLAAYADSTVDIARGLGSRVTMLGISAGGVTTAWAAQNRADIDLAVIISPAFGFKAIPTPLTAVVMNAYLLLPDSYEWWDPVLKANNPPDHTYPRYSKHALVQTLRLGYAVQGGAQNNTPGAKKILVILNPNDDSVNNERTAEITALWSGHQANLKTISFETNLKLIHDVIDPAQKEQKIDVVYPLLQQWINQMQ